MTAPTQSRPRNGGQTRQARDAGVPEASITPAIVGASLNTRKPTGQVSWPCVLIEGEEKSGKSWQMAHLTADPRVGRSFWLDLSEGGADEYGDVTFDDGTTANYDILVHDGTWKAIIGQVRAAWRYAQEANERGDKPTVLNIDPITAEWEMLKDWATNRARARRNINDPYAEVKVHNDLWNDANARHAQLMKLLLTFPGIVVIAARGKWVAAIGPGGAPIEGKKEYRVEGQKNLAFDSTIWIQMTRTAPGKIMGGRSKYLKTRPGYDEPKELARDWTLGNVVFDVLKAGQASKPRDFVSLKPGDEDPESERYVELAADLVSAQTMADWETTWAKVAPAVADMEISKDEGNKLRTIAGKQREKLLAEQSDQGSQVTAGTPDGAGQ